MRLTPPVYEKMIRTLDSCTSLEHVEACERILNRLTSSPAVHDLSRLALQIRCHFTAQQYATAE